MDWINPSEWEWVETVRNPWGVVPLTDGGKHLPTKANEYVERLISMQRQPDTESRRHHYVPKSYLRQWSADGKRIWMLDTTNGRTRLAGLSDVCVGENFYRVRGPDGTPHNRVELLFGVVDAEMRRLQVLFNHLTDPDRLNFDDLLGLAVSMSIQRMRTPQQRRLQRQRDSWAAAQNPELREEVAARRGDPFASPGMHTEMLFKGMWRAADALTTRQIEIWEDPRGRFMTCDSPVLIPFVRDVRPATYETEWILWPISPQRVIALGNRGRGEKAIIRTASEKQVAMVRDAVERGRERMIFASEEQRARLPTTKLFRRRAQALFDCSDRTPLGEHVPHPGCCVRLSDAYAKGPVVKLCDQGLHRPAPGLWTDT